MTFTDLVDDRVLLQRIARALDHLPAGQVPVVIRHQHQLLDGVAFLWGLCVERDPAVPVDEFEIDAVAAAPAKTAAGAPSRVSKPRPSASVEPPRAASMQRPFAEPPKPDPEPGGPLGRLRGRLRGRWRRLDTRHR